MKLLKPIILYSSIFICAALTATSCSEENVDNSIKVTSMSFTETGETSHVSLYPGIRGPLKSLCFRKTLPIKMNMLTDIPAVMNQCLP